jgi:hypothetical protein
MRADVLRARDVFAVALRQDRNEVAEESARMLAAGAWWIEDILALAATDRLLGDQGRKMLRELALVRRVQPNPAVCSFEDAWRTLLQEATPVRRRPGDHPAQHLLLRLLGVVWELITDRPVSRGDLRDTPFTRFLESMLDPTTGLPGISGHPAAVVLRESRGRRAWARIARGSKRINA